MQDDRVRRRDDSAQHVDRMGKTGTDASDSHKSSLHDHDLRLEFDRGHSIYLLRDFRLGYYHSRAELVKVSQ